VSFGNLKLRERTQRVRVRRRPTRTCTFPEGNFKRMKRMNRSQKKNENGPSMEKNQNRETEGEKN